MPRPEPDIALTARSVMREFYDLLEQRVKRFRTIDYAPVVAALLNSGLGDLRQAVYFPPFKLLHSLEANCAYVRPAAHDRPDRSNVAAVMNLWHNHGNPLYGDAIKRNVQQFVLLMYREQVDLQYQPHRDEVARIQRLFVSGNPMPCLANAFHRRYGLSFERWIQISWLAFAASRGRPDGAFLRDAILNYQGLLLTPHEVDTYLMLSSLTPRDIGRRFKDKVLAIKPELRFLVRSLFLESPIINFEEGRFLAPHPALVLRHSGQGLYRHVRGFPAFSQEFGASVERYVYDVLRCIDGVVHLYTSSDLEPLCPGRSCDFCLELLDVLVLVESKATTFVATGLLEDVILNDGSTGKIADGIVQLYSSAKDIRDGIYDSLALDKTKPIIGVVTTFGDVPLADSEWYYDSFLLKRAEKQLQPPLFPSPAMQRRPAILSLRALELLVMVLNAKKVSPLSLYDEKCAQEYIRVGDWEAFLGNMLNALGGSIRALDFVTEEGDRLLATLGIAPES